jgi:hypothetical protein
MLEVTVRHAARLYPWDVETSDELVEALSFIESTNGPETVVKAGYVAGTVAFVLLLGLVTTPMPLLGVAILATTLPIGVVHGVHTAPRVWAEFRRTRALGDGPNLIGRAVLRMQIQPALENAVRFAADTGYGPLADSLAAHIQRSRGTPDAGLISFADEWAEDFPAIRRAAHLLATAQDAPEAERARTLDRALGAVLDGTREQMAQFTATISAPTTALYAFGVMIPLALVALLPAARLAGYAVPIWFFVFAYNLVLPAILVGASIWILKRRPVAFPPPAVTRSHPEVPDRRWPRVLLGAAFGVAAYALTARFGPAYLATYAGVGMGVGAAMMALYHPILQVRNYVRNVERHLVDALYIVGRQVAEGEAVESAVSLAGERVPAETGDVLDDAAGLQRRLHMGVEEAFLGEYGALSAIPSPRCQSMATLLSIASEEGKPSGRALVSMADHLEELQEVERETRRQLRAVTGTLDNTAAYFAPMVAGATVGLADIIVKQTAASGGGDPQSTDSFGGAGIEFGGATNTLPPLPTDQLALVVGAFVILLCFILTPLSIALRYGLDRALLGYYVGRSLVFSIPIYVVTVVAISLFIQF